MPAGCTVDPAESLSRESSLVERYGQQWNPRGVQSAPIDMRHNNFCSTEITEQPTTNQQQ